ncbi:unnamed protein product [Clavelina lepadiformis]|uniref:Uncharacterized protein n=1 Tax=Clavelina lepadiformis TaxID=159417 RepID=A0ABP0F862_CLALP
MNVTVYMFSSRKEWSVLNNLAGRSVRLPRPSLLSSNTIATQLTKCGIQEKKDQTCGKRSV